MANALVPPMRIGVFFGGQSREREISFAGGRTVYDHLDRKLFNPVAVFVDSLGRFILLNKQHLYQGTIREFYPSAAVCNFWGIPLYIESLSTDENHDCFIDKIGKKIEPQDFGKYFDMAFLCLHGPYGEDGTIQGLLKWYKMAYTGSNMLPSAVAIDKIFQQKIFKHAGFVTPSSVTITQKKWFNTADPSQLLNQVIATVGLPFVVKSSKQGSSIGVTVVADNQINSFVSAVHKAFFMEIIDYRSWQLYTPLAKKAWFNNLIDLRQGIGFPLCVADQIFYTPHALLDYIEGYFRENQDVIVLTSTQTEEAIIVESFIQGREFSCIVLEIEEGNPIALPPTEMLKGNVHFDYKAKYLPGIVRKETPMAISPSILEAIGKEAIALFELLHCQVYARIDGFVTDDNQIILNDPNTTAGMNPSSFLFHQAAEIGLNPTQLLTFIIKRSLEVRSTEGYLSAASFLQKLEANM